MQVKKSWLLAAAGLLGLAALLAWAFRASPTAVEVAQVTTATFEQTIEEEGRTRLRTRYTLSAPLAADVLRIALREGDAVGQGDPLVTLHPQMSPLLNERSRMEAQSRLDAASARVRLAHAGLERAGVALQEAWQELQRNTRLADQGFVAESRLESSRRSVSAAVHTMEAAHSERNVALHEQNLASVALQPLAAGGHGSKPLQLRSPVAGVVLRVAQPHAATVAAGAALIDVGDPSDLEVLSELLTADASQATPGREVVIERWGGPAVSGRVRRVEPAAFTKVSALGVEEQRVNVLIDPVDPPAGWRRVGDGFRVGVRIITDRVNDAVVVPVGALFAHGDGMAVYLLEGRQARLLAIDVGARNATMAWVRKGLQPGQSVVVYPPPQLHDGAQVEVRKP